MASQGEQDLLPEQTEGFKVGEKKTLDEYKNMGKN
jgi:Rho GDP-dissociation inhibitor